MRLKINTIPYTHLMLIADIHLGIRCSSEEWQANISDYFRDFFIPKLKENITKNKTAVFVLGDVFDDRKSINIEVNNYAIDLFTELGSLTDIYVISGNHDIYKKNDTDITSLKSLMNIKNVHIINKPSILSAAGKKIICMPYLGDNMKEESIVADNIDADFIFMHTDLNGMIFDNGRQIVSGTTLKGLKQECKVLSGHIHKRQENGRLTYIGNPYQTRRSDINNQKGVYFLDLATSMSEFIPNNYSPIFQKIQYDDFAKMDHDTKTEAITNTYTDIVIPDTLFRKINPQEIFDSVADINYKRLEIQVVKVSQILLEDASLNTVSDLSIQDVIEQNINAMDITETEQQEIKILNQQYFKNIVL